MEQYLVGIVATVFIAFIVYIWSITIKSMNTQLKDLTDDVTRMDKENVLFKAEIETLKGAIQELKRM